MTTTEMRELNAWIAENVMGWSWQLTGSDPVEDGYCWFNSEGKFPCELANYTTDPAAAMDVLKKCLDRQFSPIEIRQRGFNEAHIVSSRGEVVEAKTLELAICQFAKQIISKMSHCPYCFNETGQRPQHKLGCPNSKWRTMESAAKNVSALYFVVNHLEEVKNRIGGVIGYKLNLSPEETEKLVHLLEKESK